MTHTPDNKPSFEDLVERLSKLVEIGRVVIGAIVAVALAASAVVIWVNNTSASTTQNAEAIHTLASEQAKRLEEWQKWRSQKDDIDARLTAIAEAQQRQLERLEARK
jgi:hypothetical protein